MKMTERISALAALGKAIHDLTEEEKEMLHQKAASCNNWFTKDSIELALQGVELFLDKNKLEKWVAPYRLEPEEPKKVGVVMAGNIPLVGFHDFLSVLLSGHQLHMKFSAQDPYLPDYLSQKLITIAPEFTSYIVKADLLKGMDAIIATGSDNSSRYFEYYFSGLPHIIRKNRTSCAVLTGLETTENLTALGKDIFQYYGLGCRNVSKLYVPQNFDFNPLFECLQSYQKVISNHKYNNNYDYNKSIYLVNKEAHLDTGFLLLRETQEMVSPISVVYYEYYKDRDDLEKKLTGQKDKIQCVIGNHKENSGFVAFGNSQMPGLQDYADNIDTLKFLEDFSSKK